MAVKISVQQVRGGAFIAPCLVRPVFPADIGGHQATLSKNPANPPPGRHPTFPAEHLFKLPLPIYTAVFFIGQLDDFFQFPIVFPSLAFVVISASGNAQASAKR